MKRTLQLAAVFLLLAAPGLAQSTQTETDEYTRYELLAPDSASFAIRYEVTRHDRGCKLLFQSHP